MDVSQGGLCLPGRILWLLAVLPYSWLTEARECLGRDQCSCAFDDDQSIIALNSLANSDLTPRFKDLTSADGAIYSYNPCFPFSEGDCSQAAVCMKATTGQTQNIGDAQTAQFAYKNGKLAVGYTSGSVNLATTQVILQCDLHACTPTMSVDGKIAPSFYQLTLTSVCACADGCNETGPVHCKSAGSRRTSLGLCGLIPILFAANVLTAFQI